MPNQRVTIWTKSFLLHCTGYFLLASSFYFLLPTLPIYMIDVLGESKKEVGYIIGIYSFSALLIRPFAGYSFDTFGRKITYTLGIVIYTLLMLSYNWAATFALLLLVRFLHGFAWGIVTTGGSTIVADLVPFSKRGEGIGYFGLSITLSMAMGPWIGSWVQDTWGFKVLFFSTFVLGLVALLMASGIKYPKIEAQRQKLSWGSVFEKKVLPMSLVILISAFPFAAVLSFVSIFSEEQGFGNSGLFFLFYAIGIGILRPFAGILMDRKGPKQLMIFCFVFSIAGLIMLGLSSSRTLFIISGFVLGLGNGVIMPTIQTMIINMILPERRGVANSTFFSSIDIGMGLGSILMGYLADYTSISTMYIFCGFLLLLPMAYFFTFGLRHYYQNIIEHQSS